MGRRRRQPIAFGLAAAGTTILIVLIAVLGSGSGSPSPSTHAPLPAQPAPPASAPLPAQPAPAGEQFGANVNLLFNGHGPPAQIVTRQLEALHGTGAAVARSDAFWEATEPRPPENGRHVYDWSFDDHIAAALAAAGLRWLPVLDYSAPWAQSIPGQDHSPPRSNADYAAYASAFAARYGSPGTFWAAHPALPRLPVQTYEIWNEPDSGTFWTPQPNPAGYADLYAAARTAIDGADPSARVIIGGLTQLPRFLPALLSARPALRGHIDGVAIHPYGTPDVALKRVRAARATLALLGMAGVPLYATEFGWTTQFPGVQDYVPETERPGYVLRTLAELGRRRCGLAAALLYTWYSPEQSPGEAQQWYGINGVSGNPTADTAAFAAAIRVSRDGPPSGC
jgi:hypothetical protein